MFAWLMGLKAISPARLHQLMQDKLATAIDVNSPQAGQRLAFPAR